MKLIDFVHYVFNSARGSQDRILADVNLIL